MSGLRIEDIVGVFISKDSAKSDVNTVRLEFDYPLRKICDCVLAALYWNPMPYPLPSINVSPPPR